MPKQPLFSFDFDTHLAYIYRASFDGISGYFKPISDFKRDLQLFGLESKIATLNQNTKAFMDGKVACNALLWGARGCGKSSVVHLVLSNLLHPKSNLRVIELSKEALGILPMLIDSLRDLPYRFVIFCDDLSFEATDSSFKGLKSVIEGSFESVAKNIIYYVTSNHRHLIAESYPQDTLHLNDAQDELISLSDRFALTLSFYTLSTMEFVELVESMLGFTLDSALRQKALNFSTHKGSSNPRIAREFSILYHNNML